MKTKIISKDCRAGLFELEPGTVHACITSPPYFGQRSYLPEDSPLKRFEIGTENTAAEYVSNLVAVMDGVSHVLRPDGTLWLNLADTMRDNQMLGIPWLVAFALKAEGWYLRAHLPWIKRNPKPESVSNRPSNAIEWVFLFSKEPTGYFYDAEAIRQPGCLASIERSGRGVSSSHKHVNGVPGQSPDSMHRPRPNVNKRRGHPRQEEGNLDTTTRTEQCSGTRNARNTDWFFKTFQGLLHDDGQPLALVVNPTGFKGAHTATFPKKLVEPMVLASTSPVGCCDSCGAQYERMIVKGEAALEHQRACGGDKSGQYSGKNTKDYAGQSAENASDVKARILAGMCERKTVGYQHPANGCRNVGTYVPDHPLIKQAVPAVVLDPFGGSGTVGEVANELGRNAILFDLDPRCVPLMNQRTAQSAMR